MSIVKNEEACKGPALTIDIDILDSADVELKYDTGKMTVDGKMEKVTEVISDFPFVRKFDVGTIVRMTVLPKDGFKVVTFGGQNQASIGRKMNGPRMVIADMEVCESCTYDKEPSKDEGIEDFGDIIERDRLPKFTADEIKLLKKFVKENLK